MNYKSVTDSMNKTYNYEKLKTSEATRVVEDYLAVTLSAMAISEMNPQLLLIYSKSVERRKEFLQRFEEFLFTFPYEDISGE